MKSYNINFVGSFSTGYVGEKADECILTNALEIQGHTVQRVPRDIWKAVCDGEWQDQWEDVVALPNADVNIICKWHHFNDPKYIGKLREATNAPVFYWVWDFMYDAGVPKWHVDMVNESDLYLGNDVRATNLYKEAGVDLSKLYYFPFDVADAIYDRKILPYKYDTTFFGSYVGQGDRIEWLREINKVTPIKIFGWNYLDWRKAGFDADSAVYGDELAEKVAESKIILGFNVNDHCWGYWSNRVGKILTLGGFLLYRYVPGMELFLRDGAEYFSNIAEAIEKIKYYLEHNEEREKIAQRGYEIGRQRFTSEERIKDLMILVDRYKNGAFK